MLNKNHSLDLQQQCRHWSVWLYFLFPHLTKQLYMRQW